MIRSTIKAWDFARLLVDYLEGLKDTKADRAGTHSFFAASSIRFFVLTLQCSRFVALTTELVVVRKALSKEKTARSATDQALVEQKVAQQAADQSLLSSNEANALLAQEVESTQASLTATTYKLSSKSSALHTVLIREEQMKMQLTAREKKLMVANDKIKATEENMKI
jgi:chromosome segregation ATPase